MERERLAKGQTVTKWEKRWVPVGHLKLLKWVPVMNKRKTQSMLQDPARDSRDSRDTNHTNNKDVQKGKAPLRPFNDNAPITRSITNSNKMMKDALITDSRNDGKARREQPKEYKPATTLMDGEADIEASITSTETPPTQTPPYNTPPIKFSPSTPPSPSNDMDEANDDSSNSGNGEEEDTDAIQPALKRWKSAGTT